VVSNIKSIIMKTITDLFNLIAQETTMNEGKMHQYTFDINTTFMWVSMMEHAESFDYEKECKKRFAENTIFTCESISTPEKLQLVYWTIYNQGRSKNKG